MEFTEGYEYRFIQFCESESIPYCRISGLEIKRSMGMTRGKSDEVDAYRISRYGEEKTNRLTPDKPLDPNILQLKQLLSYRKRLVRESAGFQSTIKERQHIMDSKKSNTILTISKQKIKANDRYILQVEDEIKELIKANESLLANYRILTSIKGIGPINAWMTLAYTENFTSFADARKYAVFVGVIPFEHQSGTSIKGKIKVSHMANKELKQEPESGCKICYSSQQRNEGIC